MKKDLSLLDILNFGLMSFASLHEALWYTLVCVEPTYLSLINSFFGSSFFSSSTLRGSSFAMRTTFLVCFGWVSKIVIARKIIRVTSEKNEKSRTFWKTNQYITMKRVVATPKKNEAITEDLSSAWIETLVSCIKKLKNPGL